MSYGRIAIVLGARGGLDSVIRSIDVAKNVAVEGLTTSTNSWRVPAAEMEILSLLTKLNHLDRMLRKEQIDVKWSGVGFELTEIRRLVSNADFAIEERDLISLEALADDSRYDVLLYVPLDAQQARDVEYLARLSMIAPRVRHVVLATPPKWSHSQLVALKETWEWLDPRQAQKIIQFGGGIIHMNGGTVDQRQDFAKAEFSKETGEEIIDPIIITRSARMKEVLALVDAVADTDSTVLISGESGTGKELIAQRIHIRSHRRYKALNCVNCAAIPGELLESELFGHMKGAFTGAVNNRPGRLEAAEGGTLFLDEIGEMGANLQVKLLRVLQTKKYEPVGATKSKAADVRIVAATNRDLELEVREGRFREDLFYRLNVIPVHMPTLKERPEDVQLLLEYFIKKFNREKNRRVTGVTRASMRALVAYGWPGNVRELENLMERMVILKSSGMIDLLDFPEKYRRVSLSEIEYDDLMNAARLSTGANGAQVSTKESVSVTTSVQTQSSGIVAQQTQETISTFNEIEEDLFGQGEEERGMKISGGTFTRGSINQSIDEVNQVHQDSINGIAAQSAAISASNTQGASVAISGDSIAIEQLLRVMGDKMRFPNEGLDFNSVVDQFENILILMALERTNWNRNRAAGLLRLNRTTLVEKLKKKQLVPPVRFDGSLISGNV